MLGRVGLSESDARRIIIRVRVGAGGPRRCLGPDDSDHPGMTRKSRSCPQAIWRFREQSRGYIGLGSLSKKSVSYRDGARMIRRLKSESGPGRSRIMISGRGPEGFNLKLLEANQNQNSR